MSLCEKRSFLKFLSTPSGWRATDATVALSVQKVFLSTPSGWRATGVGEMFKPQTRISIHALRVEGDPDNDSIELYLEHFYPRPPGGGRPAYRYARPSALYFYPRPPGGGRLHPVLGIVEV